MLEGTVSTNSVWGKLMIGTPGSEGKPDWFFLPHDSVLTEGTKVRFVEDVRPNAPPGFRFAKEITVIGAPVSTGVLERDTSTPSSDKTATVATNVATIPVKTVKPQAISSPSPVTTSGFSTRRIADDYNAVVNAMNKMVWSGKFGPIVYVETKLDWNNNACRELYLALKNKYHDKPITGLKLCYFFGAIGNWGKSGFRISGHTKTSDKVGQSETRGILHVDNN